MCKRNWVTMVKVETGSLNSMKKNVLSDLKHHLTVRSKDAGHS